MTEVSAELIKKIRHIQIATTRLVDAMLSGAYRSAFKGSGIEFEEVREFQTGDEMRSIDWKVTARYGKPYIKKFREERELTVFLIVDVSASLRFGTSNRQKKEMIAEIGAALAFSAIKNWDKVGLILFSDRVEHYLPPRKGVRHVLRVIRELLAFKPQGNGTDIETALNFLSKIHRRSAVCFLISDFLSEKPFSNAIKVQSKSHDLIAIEVKDPRESQWIPMGLLTLKDLETEQIISFNSENKEFQQKYDEAAVARKNNLKELMGKLGLGLLSLSTDKPYAHAIKQYFEKRKRWR